MFYSDFFLVTARETSVYLLILFCKIVNCLIEKFHSTLCVAERTILCHSLLLNLDARTWQKVV